MRDEGRRSSFDGRRNGRRSIAADKRVRPEIWRNTTFSSPTTMQRHRPFLLACLICTPLVTAPCPSSACDPFLSRAAVGNSQQNPQQQNAALECMGPPTIQWAQPDNSEKNCTNVYRCVSTTDLVVCVGGCPERLVGMDPKTGVHQWAVTVPMQGPLSPLHTGRHPLVLQGSLGGEIVYASGQVLLGILLH